MIPTKTWILAGALALAACGGKSAPATGTPTPDPDPTPTATDAPPPGSTGFPGLDWGDSREKIKEQFRGAEPRGEELVVGLTHGGADATASFMFTDDSLIAINVAFAGELPDMGACADPLHAVEAELIKSLGESSEENLAVYWTLPNAEVTLACNPVDDSGRAELTASYSISEPEE